MQPVNGKVDALDAAVNICRAERTGVRANDTVAFRHFFLSPTFFFYTQQRVVHRITTGHTDTMHLYCEWWQEEERDTVHRF